ncbi:hypothetical protein CSIM01_13609 [Colletotrichum simmondsii]|uniref:Uncharacterized protein n=1 Tax=Colletotrichum simmondsii TaxID=703756 RepID=A0A135TQ14_9PEZI|nr:hypothetical protein CSIM01_13609 [Colletotrichum simmondsii]
MHLHYNALDPFQGTMEARRHVYPEPRRQDAPLLPHRFDFQVFRLVGSNFQLVDAIDHKKSAWIPWRTSSPASWLPPFITSPSFLTARLARNQSRNKGLLDVTGTSAEPSLPLPLISYSFPVTDASHPQRGEPPSGVEHGESLACAYGVPASSRSYLQFAVPLAGIDEAPTPLIDNGFTIIEACLKLW